MFILTREKGDIESGTYATLKDCDGITVVQFFVDKDDAVCYNEQLKSSRLRTRNHRGARRGNR